VGLRTRETSQIRQIKTEPLRRLTSDITRWARKLMEPRRLDKLFKIHLNSFEKNFYQAILDIKNNKYDHAKIHIERAREILDPKITSLLGESYPRAYSLI